MSASRLIEVKNAVVTPLPLPPGFDPASRLVIEIDQMSVHTFDPVEHYIATTGDTAPIEYLASKFLQGDDARKARALARIETLTTELERTLRVFKEVS